ncbi:hypothetical protein RUM43_012005 [Polyplax serrata]|uniref:Uncharacterized protein n=1 Tax=Polyplax serrata TaxID=468196 RepID=A0AAN8S6P5_POLSC
MENDDYSHVFDKEETSENLPVSNRISTGPAQIIRRHVKSSLSCQLQRIFIWNLEPKKKFGHV